MNIRLKTVPHGTQRYATCGDWIVNDGKLSAIIVSDTGNEDYAFLIAIHEMIEAWLCLKKGITQEQVDAFDIQFEKERELGMHGTDEPGFAKDAPYRNEHAFATKIEKMLAKKLNIDWEKYDKLISEL